MLTFVIIGLLIWQNNRTERRSDIKDAQLRKEREKSDSTITMGIKNGVDSNRKILFSDLSEALAKQNLRLDTVTKNLTAIKDSAKKVTIINSEDPNFDLCDIKPLPQTKDSMILKYFFCSENATSYDITVTLDILAKKNRLINTSHFIII